jgi:5-methylcytosine-specific restriction endonuclease McrA
MYSTLVLNNAYQPIRIVPVRKALKDLANGRVELLEGYADVLVWISAKLSPLPCVVRFLRWSQGKYQRNVKFNRVNVWKRDKGACQYCGVKVDPATYQYEHVLPKSRGGRTTWENIVVACCPCNQKKRDRTPEEAGMRLLRKPVKPKSLPSGNFQLRLGSEIPTSWNDYLGSVEYWTGTLED